MTRLWCGWTAVPVLMLGLFLLVDGDNVEVNASGNNVRFVDADGGTATTPPAPPPLAQKRTVLEEQQQGKLNDGKSGGGAAPGKHKKPGSTDLTTDPFRDLLVVSSLDGTLTAVDRVSGELRWVSKDDKPMIQVPTTTTSSFPPDENPGSNANNSPKAPYFLPDPKTGSLYMMGKQNSLRKLPFTIPQLVAMAPCRNSEGLMYTGRKLDTWVELNPFTGEKSELPVDGTTDATCPAWSKDNPSGASESDSCSAESAMHRNRMLKSLLIGKTEYTLSMMDGVRRWNVTYHHYSSKDMNPQAVQDYELVHFTSPSTGSLITYDRVSGGMIWQRDLDSPVIGVYRIDGTSTNLVSVPFNPIASDTLNRLKADTNSEKPLSPTTYVGECAYGLYAVPALADDQVLMIGGEGSTLPPLLEGPIGPSSSAEGFTRSSEYLLLGYYQVNEPGGSSGATGGSLPSLQLESGQDAPQIPSGAFNESGYLEDAKVIPVVGEKDEETEIKRKPVEEQDDLRGKSPNRIMFPPPPLTERKRVGKEEIKIVFTTAIISIGLTSSVLGVIFIAYRRYKNDQLAMQHKLLSSDSGLLGDSSAGTATTSLTASTDSTVSAVTRGDSGNLTVGKISVFGSQVLGKGCEGTFVFKGKFEGRDVAVKRILPECFQLADREVDLLKESDQHPNVVRYFCTESDGQFRYIALELCVATLHDWVDGRYVNEAVDATQVLKEATEGLAHLHSLRIVHRDVKPANVLLGVGVGGGSGVRTMISDFGLCKKLRDGRMSFSRRSGGIPGTDGWIAPEVITFDSEPERMTHSVDIFSMGCVYYYVLTKGKHPFGDPFRRQSNILNGEHMLDGIGENPLGAYDLIRTMISRNPADRPPLTAVLTHPVFWSREKVLGFFLDVSDRIEKESEDTFPLLRRLESGAGEVVKGDWRDHICEHVAMDLRKYRTYKGHSIRDLLRALRNKKNHYRELTMEAQASLGDIPDQFASYWVTRFPLLVPYVWARFEVLKGEAVFSKYYDPRFEFWELLVGDDDVDDDDQYLRDSMVVEEVVGVRGDERNNGKPLGKDFWKSKSQAKYQRWRSNNHHQRFRGDPIGSPKRGAVVLGPLSPPQQPQVPAAGELSASTDNDWRGRSPGRSPGGSPHRRPS